MQAQGLPEPTQHEAALGGRTFPTNTLRGALVVLDFPQAQLDGRAEQLAPGVRIRDAHNRIVVPSSIAGQPLAVNYWRDAAGAVGEVWILTPVEASAPRAGVATATGTPFLNFWPFVWR